jgi:branched-chain amino acid transport system substrate-binding protein
MSTRSILVALLVGLVLLGSGPAPAAAEQGVTDTEILLGGSNSFSGPLAFTGTQLTKMGVDLYFRVLNDAGGVHGRKIRTIYYDDGYRPQDAVANTKKLVEQDGIFAVIAPQGSPPVVATLDYLEQAKVPMLFPFQSSTATRSKKYVFSGLVLSDRQSHMMIDYLAGPRKFKRFAALYQDDEYGKSFLTAFEADLGRHGLKLAATEPVKRGVTDVSAQIAKLQVARPEVTFLVLTPGPLTDETYLGLAADASEGVEGLATLPDPLRSDAPGVKLYREHLQKYAGKNEPNRYSLSGYLAGMLFAEAAKRAGRNLTRDGLVAALETFKGYDTGIVPPITIGPDHDTQKQGFWVKVENGRFKPLSDWLRSE